MPSSSRYLDYDFYDDVPGAPLSLNASPLSPDSPIDASPLLPDAPLKAVPVVAGSVDSYPSPSRTEQVQHNGDGSMLQCEQPGNSSPSASSSLATVGLEHEVGVAHAPAPPAAPAAASSLAPAPVSSSASASPV